MIEAGAPSTGCCRYRLAWCARPTGGSHGRTTDDPAQRFKDAKRRPRWKWGKKSAAKDSVRPQPESPVRGLRRTALGRAPRATSTPPRAAPPRLASYNGMVGGTVGRASRARLLTPRQPTPLLSGTCLTSAGRPPLRRILATEGPGHYVVLSSILQVNFREFLFHALR